MLVTNKKKPIRLTNRTKYFNPNTDRTHVKFSSPDSYQSRQMKIEGYETRTYWQFKYCQENDGQTFFYTLTYNDAHMPKHYGINCFDYEDLRFFETGGFRKQLLRKYGTTFKYFIGAELGDGKGERGMHNNPHYHILFFLEPAHNDRFPYKKISSTDFRHLVRLYWQGFDEDTDGFRDYNEAKYGIAKEGDNIGLVTDFRAEAYCAKYVCKDAKLKMHESNVERLLRWNAKRNYKYGKEFSNHFFYNDIYRMFNLPANGRGTKWMYDEIQLITLLLGEDAFDYLEVFRSAKLDGSMELLTKKQLIDTFATVPDDFRGFVADICKKYHLWKEYWKAFDAFVDEKVRLGMNEYRNRYCNKCRVSHGLGDYALRFVDRDNPTIQVPGKKGPKNRPLSMYYYRKLFTKVIIDKKGSPIRVLTDEGIEYKKKNLPKQIEKMKDKAASRYLLLLDNKELFEKMRASDINTDVVMHHSEYVRTLDKLLKDDTIDNILQRYAEYKLVYEDRFFAYSFTELDSPCDFPRIDVLADYGRFLVPSIYSVSRSDLRLASFLEDNCPDMLPYSQHPYFLRYLGVFGVFDMCSDYFFVKGDDKKQSDAEDIARTKRFHTERRLKEFYANFKN